MSQPASQPLPAPKQTPLPAPAVATADEIELARAAGLVESLRRGVPLPVLPASIPLYANERLHGVAGCNVSAFSGQYVEYRSSYFAFGRLPLMAMTLGASALHNAAKRRRAEQQARPQWRFLGSSTMYLTNMRVALAVPGGFDDIWLNDVEATNVLDGGIELIPRGAIAKRIELGSPLFWYVMMAFVRNGDVPGVTVGERVAQAARAHGIYVTGRTEGWHADPMGTYEFRYFDGDSWTHHVSSDGVASRDRTW